jgi:hypothetical protein
MHIMISQHADGRRPKISDSAEGLERSGAAVDKIADEPELIRGRIEPNFIQQNKQFVMAALNVADGVSGHGF